MNKALANYRKNQVSGMSQKELIVLLYDGALRFLDQANGHLEKKETNEFADKLERVHRIVYHLYTTLDFDKGGEIAEKLGSLYSFVISQLYILNSTKNPQLIVDIKAILSDLRDGWQNIGRGAEPSQTENADSEQKRESVRGHSQNPEVNKAVSVQV